MQEQNATGDLNSFSLIIFSEKTQDNPQVFFECLVKDATYKLKIDDDEIYAPVSRSRYIPPGIISISHNPAAINDKLMLLVGDSFSSALRPYFITMFRDVVHIHYSPEDYSDVGRLQNYINTYDPDTIVYGLVARSL